jgi:pimeloyl-ACP methyl ester carboxylesterase
MLGRLGIAAMLLVQIPGLRLSAQSKGDESSSFVSVPGGKLYFQECGAGPEAVVLIHDGVVHSAVWDDVWPSFCARFHTVRYDRRGYGRSPSATAW